MCACCSPLVPQAGQSRGSWGGRDQVSGRVIGKCQKPNTLQEEWGRGREGPRKWGGLSAFSVFMLLLVSGLRLEGKGGQQCIDSPLKAIPALSHCVTLKMTFSSSPWQYLLGGAFRVNVFTS